MGEPHNSSKNSTGVTERAGEWEARDDLLLTWLMHFHWSPQIALTTKASYPEVEGPGQGATQEALSLFLEKTYESHDRNFLMREHCSKNPLPKAASPAKLAGRAMGQAGRNLGQFLNIYLDFSFSHRSQIWCRLVTAAYNYFHVTNFFWMFGEGCYLHTAIVLTYSTDKLRKWMFICIGWCIPFPIIVAWAIGKLYYDNEKCWFGKRAGIYTDYIYQGPMILVLLINFIFLFNIVRILMTKLRASTTSETIQYRKAVKATLVLLPLLGITYMLFFVNPGEDEISQIVFIYFNSFLESFQGFFVSVFYCFLNSEVRSAVRKRWHRWQDKHSIRARVARAMSIPTSPTRVSFHSIKQSSAI
ncbi:corticotropin-releasing factor receptor 1-like [Sinocyclocheilus grahami]|uniref:corticotropin-releasing factor receptor 1-like n=1 Tax=Sinocyclocheilus grahami TaxID=75366 RepID=UPI0007AD425C|nr:PREDICTED: corticotropin-releasing factor receptor 1-like [Sinocyclocheilus grahami]